MDILYELEKGAIVIVALMVAFAEFTQASRRPTSWVRWGLGFVGIYWAAYYAYSIYRGLFGGALDTHQIFVRSGILLTLSLVASNAIINLREYKWRHK